MNERRRTPFRVIILVALLLLNFGWTSLNLYRSSRLRVADAEHFEIKVLHTNSVSPWPYLVGDPSAVGLVDVKSGKPIWAKWLFDYGESGDIEDYYFQGKHVFDMYSTNNRPWIYNVYFHGPGKSITWWRNRGGADTFTERTFYDTNGDLSKDQVWYSNTWYTVDVQNGANGVIINGQWRELAFDTNGMWAIEPIPAAE